MVRVGIVGLGFMGRMHYRAWGLAAGAEVVCVCEREGAAVVRGAGGNIAGAEGAIDWERVRVYTELEEMLAAEQLDAVSVTAPTHLHEALTCRCLEAGLHVLCEKPMALTSGAGERMAAAARVSGRRLQVGHCLRFWPEYVYARRVVESGEYGAVLAGRFWRYSSRPGWGGWLVDERLSGGMILDLHIHDVDVVRYLFGGPEWVDAAGAVNGAGELVHVSTRYGCGQGRLVQAEAGWDVTGSYGFGMGYELMLEGATVVYDSRRGEKLWVWPEGGEGFRPELAGTDGYCEEVAHFARAVRGEEVAEVITVEDAVAAVRLVELERASLREKSKVKS